MFGFITINENDLSECETVRYKQVYCGVCRALCRRYGQRGRLVLNHDLTFMALVHLSLYEPTETLDKAACPMHPFAKRSYVESAPLDYAADMTIALAYHKCLDDVDDDNSYTARLGAAALRRCYHKVEALRTRQCRALEEGLASLARIEAAHDGGFGANPDTAAHEFGCIMGELFVWHQDFWESDLRAFGYELGRFIYLMDAAVDKEPDSKKGSYNPFAASELTADELRTLLSLYLARATALFERLPLVQDAHLLQSALYSGVWGQFNIVYGSPQEAKLTKDTKRLRRVGSGCMRCESHHAIRPSKLIGTDRIPATTINAYKKGAQL